MHAVDPFVKALADLCAREGGYAFVADKAKVNADGLWQILNGVKLPSGNPRGVGPGTRKKITDAYPDWLEAKITQPAGPSSTAIPNDPGTLPIEILMAGLSAYLSQMDADARDDAGDVLRKLAAKPENHARAAAMFAAAFQQRRRKVA